MIELSDRIKKAANLYAPIKAEGFVCYPIRVKEFDEFCLARPAIDFLQQSLPVALMSIPLLSAYFKLASDPDYADKPERALFSCAIAFLALSLRIGDGMPLDKRLGLFRFEVKEDKPDELKALYFVVGDELARMTPMQFQLLRPIFAVQNGITLYPDDANPELVEAEKALAQDGAEQLDANIDDMKSAVALITGANEDEIEEWPILKLTRRAESFRRILDYAVVGIGQFSGNLQIKKGQHPCPSPFYAKRKTGTAALTTIESFADGAGARAAKNPSTAAPVPKPNI